MNKFDPFLNEWTPYALSVLRIVLGFLFLQHGMQKLFGYPSAPPGGKPPLGSLYGVAGILGVFRGLLIMFWLFTRPRAFFLSRLTSVGFFKGHAPAGFSLA